MPFSSSKQTSDILAVKPPASAAQSCTSIGAPATSKDAHKSPPPSVISPSTSTPVVTPTVTTLNGSKSLGNTNV